MTISSVAEKAGVRASAIRYYEEIKLMEPPLRVGGRRRYGPTVLYRLAVIQRAKQLGFTLGEICQLFSGFGRSLPASRRWRSLSQKKLAELEDLALATRAMQRLLRRLIVSCHCRTLDDCGKAMLLRSARTGRTTRSIEVKRRRTKPD